MKGLLDRPIAYHRCLFKLTHSIKAALMLSQAIFWSKRTKDEDGWFYKSRYEWQSETDLTREEQEGARRILRQLGFWQEKLQGVPGRLFYRVDLNLLYQKLIELHEQEAEKHANKLGKTRQLESGKPASKLVKNYPTSWRKDRQHSLQRLQHRLHTTTVVVVMRPKKNRKRALPSRSNNGWRMPSINNKVAFANAIARASDNDGVMELYLEIQQQGREAALPLNGCDICRYTGWELVPGKGVKPCACRTPAN